MKRGCLDFPKDVYEHREMETDMIPGKIHRPVADFVVRAIERQAYLDDLKAYPIGRGELRADDDPVVSVKLGESIWGLISAMTP